MPNEQFQARMDDEMAEDIHKYRRNNGMTSSEAMRHLIRVGLDAERETDPLDEDGELRDAVEALADGGHLREEIESTPNADDVDELRAQTEAHALARKRQTVAIVAALAYIGLTLATGLSGLLWAVVGAVLLLVVVAVGLFGGEA